MLPQVESLAREIEAARAAFVREVEALTPEQARFRPGAGAWSATEVVEHLVWAEHSGLNKMMVALEAWRSGAPVWEGDNPNRGESIDAVIARTWRPKEVAPPIAEPRMGGPLPYWLAFLRSCRSVVEDVAARIGEDELDEVVFPHFLSGPLTLRQRLAFLRYHLEHHRPQIDALRRHPDFPPGR